MTLRNETRNIDFFEKEKLFLRLETGRNTSFQQNQKTGKLPFLLRCNERLKNVVQTLGSQALIYNHGHNI